jgi:hypothetical protein
MPHADFVCAAFEAGKVVCQNIVPGMQDIRAELPESEGAVELTAGSGGLVVCGADATHAWTCWNVPSFVWSNMGVENVAGVFPFEIRSEVPPRELVIAGFRFCVLREDASVACGDGATSESAAKLLTDMRIELSAQVDGLPE